MDKPDPAIRATEQGGELGFGGKEYAKWSHVIVQKGTRNAPTLS